MTLEQTAITALVLFMVGTQFIPFAQDSIDDFRTSYQCSTNSSISDGAKASCLVTDIGIPYFIWLLVSLAIGLLLGGGK